MKLLICNFLFVCLITTRGESKLEDCHFSKLLKMEMQINNYLNWNQ
ncbi:hypothetical protein DDB_G0283045 [Dictyostelium discoideum AX4]|nr:hypothetical protein DDB_G0283045 [Dictyostelium discoideum AX4]EAL65966.1 hypothetical protein DDB_G0283045 [Dictyostelium discoideum AX4]|eukprot:XP_639264.1 hypothetical protein DDB_G0283045 [Dictyostelium discoideum AX4]